MAERMLSAEDYGSPQVKRQRKDTHPQAQPLHNASDSGYHQGASFGLNFVTFGEYSGLRSEHDKLQTNMESLRKCVEETHNSLRTEITMMREENKKLKEEVRCLRSALENKGLAVGDEGGGGEESQGDLRSLRNSTGDNNDDVVLVKYSQEVDWSSCSEHNDTASDEVNDESDAMDYPPPQFERNDDESGPATIKQEKQDDDDYEIQENESWSPPESSTVQSESRVKNEGDEDISQEDDLQEDNSQEDKQFSESTKGKIAWAVDLFSNWREARNTAVSQDAAMGREIPTKSLEQFTTEELGYSLQKFVTDIRKKKDGKPYPGKTLREIIICLQMYLDKKGVYTKLLDKRDFSGLNKTLNFMVKQSKQEGCDEGKRATELTIEQEEILWEKNILGSDTPEKLVKTLYFLIGIHFALRGGKEHKYLRVGANSQFKIGFDASGNKYLQYTQTHAKTKGKDAPRNSIQVLCNSNSERCLVCLYEKYMSLRSDHPTDFYLYGLKFPNSDNWYTERPLGIHALQAVVANICKEAGFEGNFTGHSLRATATTRLFRAGFDEKAIKEVTGHRSNAIRLYKGTNDSQVELN